MTNLRAAHDPQALSGRPVAVGAGFLTRRPVISKSKTPASGRLRAQQIEARIYAIADRACPRKREDEISPLFAPPVSHRVA